MAVAIAWLVAALCLMVCVLHEDGVRQIVAELICLSILDVPPRDSLKDFFFFFDPLAWAWLHICGFFRAVAPGSHLRAWAPWEGTKRIQ